jgi:fatty-acyl-CoA synthase
MIVPLTPLEFRARAAQLYRSKIGIVDGARRFTYGEYDERVSRLAGFLKALGLEPGEVVSYLAFNSHQLLEGYYGVLQAGGVLNPVNIRLTPQEMAYILAHSDTRVVIFHETFRPLVEHLRASLPSVRRFVICESATPPEWAIDYETALAGAVPHAPDLDGVDENAIAELFYTSGTTGQPKGVASTHRTLYLHGLSGMWSMRVTDADVMLHVVPLFRVNGWGSPHSVTAAGGRHVMMRRFDPVELMRLVQEVRVTTLLAVPLIFNALVNHPRLGEFDLSSLKTCIAGGAPSSLQLIAAIEQRLHCTALVGYGLTETSPVLTLAWPKDHLREPQETRLAYQARTGLPVPGVRLRVVDLRGNDIEWNGEQVGEIIVRSNFVMEGYYKDPRATEAAIRDGWFYTGDMAVVDPEGYVLIVDRRKDIIISGGENISSVEIENAVYKHPAVLECAVVAVPDETWGEVPLAAVVLKPGAQVTEEELQMFLREPLAHFKVPKYITFHDELPKGGTGKIIKAAIRDPYWKGQPRRVN